MVSAQEKHINKETGKNYKKTIKLVPVQWERLESKRNAIDNTEGKQGKRKPNYDTQVGKSDGRSR